MKIPKTVSILSFYYIVALVLFGKVVQTIYVNSTIVLDQAAVVHRQEEIAQLRKENHNLELELSKTNALNQIAELDGFKQITHFETLSSQLVALSQ